MKQLKTFFNTTVLLVAIFLCGALGNFLVKETAQAGGGGGPTLYYQPSSTAHHIQTKKVHKKTVKAKKKVIHRPVHRVKAATVKHKHVVASKKIKKTVAHKKVSRAKPVVRKVAAKKAVKRVPAPKQLAQAVPAPQPEPTTASPSLAPSGNSTDVQAVRQDWTKIWVIVIVLLAAAGVFYWLSTNLSSGAGTPSGKTAPKTEPPAAKRGRGRPKGSTTKAPAPKR